MTIRLKLGFCYPQAIKLINNEIGFIDEKIDSLDFAEITEDLELSECLAKLCEVRRTVQENIRKGDMRVALWGSACPNDHLELMKTFDEKITNIYLKVREKSEAPSLLKARPGLLEEAKVLKKKDTEWRIEILHKDINAMLQEADEIMLGTRRNKRDKLDEIVGLVGRRVKEMQMSIDRFDLGNDSDKALLIAQRIWKTIDRDEQKKFNKEFHERVKEEFNKFIMKVAEIEEAAELRERAEAAEAQEIVEAAEPQKIVEAAEPQEIAHQDEEVYIPQSS